MSIPTKVPGKSYSLNQYRYKMNDQLLTTYNREAYEGKKNLS